MRWPGPASYGVGDLAGNLAGVAWAMCQLAEGDRSVAVLAIHRRDEIGTLARSFEVFKENAFRFDAASGELVEQSRLLCLETRLQDGMWSVCVDPGQLENWS